MLSALVLVCLLGLSSASILDLVNQTVCHNSVPVIPAVTPKNGQYEPEDMGEFYQYAVYQSNGDPCDITCSKITLQKENVSRISDGDSYTYVQSYVNITTNETVVAAPLYFRMLNDETNDTYVEIEKSGATLSHANGGRVVIKKKTGKGHLYYVNYGFDEVLHNCKLYWQLYGPSKDFDEEEYMEALAEIHALKLPSLDLDEHKSFWSMVLHIPAAIMKLIKHQRTLPKVIPNVHRILHNC